MIYCDTGDALIKEMVDIYMNPEKYPLSALDSWHAGFDEHCNECFTCRTTTERLDKKTPQSVAE
jgi:hypothetical protein